ncbi:hypothetical protein ACIRG5_23735 [Lentzea sp. NPDC102401]
MTPAEACDLVDFGEAAPWPFTRDQVRQPAVERLGTIPLNLAGYR